MYIYILEISASLSNDQALFSCPAVSTGKIKPSNSLIVNLNQTKDMSFIPASYEGGTYNKREPSGPLFP
jgi:hypothetical protein